MPEKKSSTRSTVADLDQNVFKISVWAKAILTEIPSPEEQEIALEHISISLQKILNTLRPSEKPFVNVAGNVGSRFFGLNELEKVSKAR